LEPPLHEMECLQEEILRLCEAVRMLDKILRRMQVH